MPERIITVGRDALLAEGIPADRIPPGPVRIAVRYEPEEDGTHAVGYYLQAATEGGWRDIPIADNLDEAAGYIRALERAAHHADPNFRAWLAEWDAFID